MSNPQQPHQLTKPQRRLSTLILSLVAAHVIIVITLSISDEINQLLNQYRFSKLYKIFAIPGPFFSEDRINNTVQLFVQTKSTNSTWNELDHMGAKEFEGYHANYFRYDLLCKSGIPRFFARQIAHEKEDKRKNSKFFRELNQYLKQNQYPGYSDSVRVLFIRKDFETHQADTFFNYHYSLK